MATPWRVMKFGGTSVAAAEHWCAISDQVRRALATGRRPLVVVSALAGVTDRLLALAQGHVAWEAARATLEQQHGTLADALGLEDRSWLDRGLARLEGALGETAGPRRQAAILAVLGFLPGLGVAWWLYGKAAAATNLPPKLPCQTF